VKVVSVEDREAGRATLSSDDGWHTWTLQAEMVRDFAIAAGGTYVWHVTGAETGHEQGRALIQNVFDPRMDHWAPATEYAQHAIEFFSDYILPYPYPQATAAMGPPEVSGMEYPMITFITHQAEGRGLNGVVTHELSHFWMPMIVGTKEMAYAWMDEGLTVFNTSLSMADYYDTPVARPGDDRGYAMIVQMEMQEPIMGHMDHAEHQFGASVAAYSKPGMLLHTLRHMIGQEKFDAFYKDYAATWAYKHPMPWDFFAMMSETAGADLDWFWQPWFYGTATLDQAIDEVVPGSGSAEITVSNLSSGVMPVEMTLEYADGSTETVVWPPSVWAGTRTATGMVPTSGDLTKVTIDADGNYPDLDRSNNEWEAVEG
jgi:aminopeptidase N